MIVYLRAGGQLREMLKPNVDDYTREIEAEEGMTISEILKKINIETKFIAFIYVDGKVMDFSYVPSDGQTVTLQPPVSGG